MTPGATAAGGVANDAHAARDREQGRGPGPFQAWSSVPLIPPLRAGQLKLVPSEEGVSRTDLAKRVGRLPTIRRSGSLPSQTDGIARMGPSRRPTGETTETSAGPRGAR